MTILDRLTDADYLADGDGPDREDSFAMDSFGNRTGSQTLSDDTEEKSTTTA